MDAMSYSHARAHLARAMDQVCEDHAPLIITRKGAVVMIALEDYQALEETAYLLRSPKNARRLLESIADYWSRCIDEEHRLVYKVEGDELRIAQLRHHY